MFLAPTSDGLAFSTPTIVFEIVRQFPGASGRPRSKGERKRHQRADAAHHDPNGAHEIPVVSWFRARRPGLHPRGHERAGLFLRAGRGLPAGTGRPRPADQMILADMLHKRLQRAAAIPRGVLDLGANLAERLAFPCHFARREMPDRISGNRAEVRGLMADRTAQRRQAEAVGAALTGG